MVRYLYRITNTAVTLGPRLSNTFNIEPFPNASMSDAGLNTVINAFNTFYTSNASYLATNCFWTSGTRVLQYDLDAPGTAPVIRGATAVTSTGGTGGDGLPTSTAMCISWRTAFAGPSTRGRTFFGVLPKTVLSSGMFTSAITGTIVSRCAILLTSIQAAAGSPSLVVYSKKFNSTTTIASATIDAVPDNLRSRKY